MEKMLDFYDRWAAAYALATGVKLVKVLPGGWTAYTFDDSDGQASRALGEWRAGQALVQAKAYAEAFRQLRRY
ncbi:MAG TPA: hypothetical protein VH599_18395 [Ktedonobacterales bacterium]